MHCVRQPEASCGYKVRYMVPDTSAMIRALQLENERLRAELELTQKPKPKNTPKKTSSSSSSPINASTRKFLKRLAQTTFDSLVARDANMVRSVYFDDLGDMLVDEFDEIMHNYSDVAEEFTHSRKEYDDLPEDPSKATIEKWFEVYEDHIIQLVTVFRQDKRFEMLKHNQPKKISKNAVRAARELVAKAIARKRLAVRR